MNVEWQGSFISGDRSHREAPGPALYFRHSFRVGPGLDRAELSVTGLGLVEAYLNGNRVGDELLCPGWTSYRHRLQVSSHDVGGLLVEGENALGATTIWERWDAVLPDGKLNSTGMTSLNHYAFGSVAAWLHRVVGGIEAIEPGYRRVRIAPTPGGGLEWARTSHRTAHGQIAVDWANRSGEREVRVTIPDGVTAEIVLPGHEEGFVAAVEAGTHDWTYPVQPDSHGVYSSDTPSSS